MSTTPKTVIAAVAALALAGTMVTSSAPADAHTYASEGSVSTKEGRKLLKEMFKQKCLTMHEARHIAHGDGSVFYPGDESASTGLHFDGTSKSRFGYVDLYFDDRDGRHCAVFVQSYRKQ